MKSAEQRVVDLAQQLADFLTWLVENGFEPPFHVAVLGTNGAGFLLTYEVADGGLEPIFHYDSRRPLRTPVNMMFVDQRGEAARACIGPQGSRITCLN
jgi:hypothetical protein